MTPEQIRQIAEEYADMYMEQNIPLISKKDNIRNTYIQEATTVLSTLSERYCVVERSKVVEMYPHYDNFNTFNRGVCYCLRILFGSETFNNE